LPGYDPVELFVDPNIKSPKLKIALTLLKRKLGGRSLMDLTPLTAGLVQGSHGHIPASDADRPVLISHQSPQGKTLDHPKIAAIDVFDVILRHLKS
jgi:hypothetical protein